MIMERLFHTGSTYVERFVEIDDFVWLGSDVTVSGNVKIGEGAIVAIGSVVVERCSSIRYCRW